MRLLIIAILGSWFCASIANAQIDGLGQVLQINTRFHSFLGKPEWLIEIRDLDHGQTIPYVYDITRGQNDWVLFTYSKNYLITTSTIQFSSYRSRYNVYNTYKIENFCNLESRGRIARGESMFIWIEGDLLPNSNRYHCHVTRFKDNDFTITSSES